MSDDQLNTAPSQSNLTEEGVKTTTTAVEDPSDRLTPDHPRFKEVLQRAKEAEEKSAELERKLEDLSEQIRTRQAKDDDDSLTEEEERALAKINAQLRKRYNFATKDDLEQLSSVEKRALTHDKLSTRFDGTNGYPKYDSLEVTEYAKRNGFGDNYEAAYKVLHHDAIVKVEARRLNESPTPPSSERASGGDRTIEGTQITPAKISAMDINDWEQNREKVLASIKDAAKRAGGIS